MAGAEDPMKRLPQGLPDEVPARGIQRGQRCCDRSFVAQRVGPLEHGVPNSFYEMRILPEIEVGKPFDHLTERG